MSGETVVCCSASTTAAADPAAGLSCDSNTGGCEPAGTYSPVNPDWEGLKRDTWYFMGAQFASLGILYVLPEAVSSWSDDQKDSASLSKWWRNASDPHIDSDDFYLNYILHPYWGGTYYVRARERGYDKLEAFWYSAFLSSFYEFGPEALFEQASIQDLFVTPVFGSLLGEYFMTLRNDVRERSSARGYRTRGETWVWYLTDPLNLLNKGIDRMLGRNARLTFQPIIRPGSGKVLAARSTPSLRQGITAFTAAHQPDKFTGIATSYPLNNFSNWLQVGSAHRNAGGLTGFNLQLSW